MSALNPLAAIAYVAERKIEEAIAEGQLDNLPGAGHPLELEDLSHLPEDMRMAYVILKNSGCLEDDSKTRPATMGELMRSLPEERREYGKMQRLRLLLRRAAPSAAWEEKPWERLNRPQARGYLGMILNRLSRSP